MLRIRLTCAAAFAAFAFAAHALAQAAPAETPPPALLRAGDQTQASGATTATGMVSGRTWLRLTCAGGNATLSVTPASESWDLTRHAELVIPLANRSTRSVTVRATVANAGATEMSDSCRGVVQLTAGEEKDLVVHLTRRPVDPGYDRFDPFYMYTKRIDVRANTIDPAAVARLEYAIEDTVAGQMVDIGTPTLVGEGANAPVPFFPFIDGYGQYEHADWNGKIYADSDFAKRLDEEEQERRAWPGPDGRDEYGGWAAGPLLEATGYFRVQKYEDMWWLVDPAGRLFWSNGPTGVGLGGDLTPITDRRDWFAELPDRDGPLGQFYGDKRNATYKYYQYRQWTGFNIQTANLYRKYGPDYKTRAITACHERLRSWGFNTLGNWSSLEARAGQRTPYVVPIHYGTRMMHYRMPDIYSPDWEPALRKSIAREADTSAKDPWNIGYFVDNERWFGPRPRAAAIGEEALKNPADAPVKLKFVEFLRAKYDGDVDGLNAAWKTHYASWQALLADRADRDFKVEAILSDAGDFGMMFAEKYFRTCRDAVKNVAPNHMYLGSRFHGHIDKSVVELASKYADVISYNIYDNPPDGRVNQYASLDVPIMATEWGIDSDPQQTPFRGESLKVLTPAERAKEMQGYLERAIRHPNLVGAHFFQFRDQPLSGRSDGEATLRGFVNVADTPNFELVRASREVNYDLYQKRASAGERRKDRKVDAHQ